MALFNGVIKMRRTSVVSAALGLALAVSLAMPFEQAIAKDKHHDAMRMPSGFDVYLTSVHQVQTGASDEAEVMIKGRLTGYLYDNNYEFTDEQGQSIEVELDDDTDWSHVHKDQLIEIYGEVERNMFKVKIDAKHYRILEAVGGLQSASANTDPNNTMQTAATDVAAQPAAAQAAATAAPAADGSALAVAADAAQVAQAASTDAPGAAPAADGAQVAQAAPAAAASAASAAAQGATVATVVEAAPVSDASVPAQPGTAAVAVASQKVATNAVSSDVVASTPSQSAPVQTVSMQAPAASMVQTVKSETDVKAEVAK